MSSGARLWPVMPNGRMEIPVSSRCGLDGSFHMDADASHLGNSAGKRKCATSKNRQVFAFWMVQLLSKAAELVSVTVVATNRPRAFFVTLLDFASRSISIEPTGRFHSVPTERLI